jgi:hypothetical protein
LKTLDGTKLTDAELQADVLTVVGRAPCESAASRVKVRVSSGSHKGEHSLLVVRLDLKDAAGVRPLASLAPGVETPARVVVVPAVEGATLSVRSEPAEALSAWTPDGALTLRAPAWPDGAPAEPTVVTVFCELKPPEPEVPGAARRFDLEVKEPPPPPTLIRHGGAVVPHFGQADPAWGSNALGTADVTISAKGCAVSSLAMVLKYYGRSAVDPGVLDAWLDANGGYGGDTGNAVVWAKALTYGEDDPNATRLHWTATEAQATFAATLEEQIAADRPTIAHVDYGDDTDGAGNHFVVVVGRTAEGEFVMNDPATSSGNGALDPSDDNLVGKTTRRGGYTIVKLHLISPA